MSKALFSKNELAEIKETLQVIRDFIDNLQQSSIGILSEIEDLENAFDYLESAQDQIELDQNLFKSLPSLSLTTVGLGSLIGTSQLISAQEEAAPVAEKVLEEIESWPLSLSTFNSFLSKIKQQGQGKIGIGRSKKDFEDLNFFFYPEEEEDWPELISRKHAEIFFANNQFFVKDHNSSHGTFINGHRIQAGEYISFASGDTIKFAKSRVLTFVPSLFRLRNKTRVN